MISGFLNHPEELPEYVVASCHKKMDTRLNHVLSKPYLDFLHTTSTLIDTAGFPGFTDEFSTSEYSEQRLSTDCIFFSAVFPAIMEVLEKDFPKLRLAAKKVDGTGSFNPYDVYNKDTYMEYHTLLCELVNHFRNGLQILSHLKKVQKKEDFLKHVQYVAILGDFLQTMVWGSVIDAHLKIITKAAVIPTSCLEEVGSLEVDGNEDLYAFGVLPCWQAIREWLKLIVVHFDAIFILSSHMKRVGDPRVTIKVLDVPHPGIERCHWKETLEDEKYFPEGRKNDKGNPSTSEIIEFINNWRNKQVTKELDSKRIETVIQTFKDLYWPPDVILTEQEIDAMVKQISSMSCCSSPGSSAFKESIISDVILMKTDNSNDLKDRILCNLRRLMEKARLFNTLDTAKFNGSIHCELLLASFMSPARKIPSTFQNIVNELSVGVINLYIQTFFIFSTL